MEIREIIGQVIEKGTDFIKVKRENKSIKINFRKNENLIKNVEVSESYKVKYLDNEKDGIIYHNGKSIEPIISKETLQEKTGLKNGTVKPKFISDTTINCLVMQSVQLAIEKDMTLDLATNEVIKSYNKIKEIV